MYTLTEVAEFHHNNIEHDPDGCWVCELVEHERDPKAPTPIFDAWKVTDARCRH